MEKINYYNMRKIILVFIVALLSQSLLMAQIVPSPKSHFGFNIGDNYQLTTFTQTEAYLKKLAAVSKKVKLQVIGKTEEGRNQYMVIVSDPSNLANIEKYKNISQKLAHAENADVYFSASPVFNLLPDAIARKEVVPLAWYASDKTLRSGWAFGQSYLQDGIAAFEAKVGDGKLFVYGPEITFRGQTHSTYKMLFNQLYK